MTGSFFEFAEKEFDFFAEKHVEKKWEKREKSFLHITMLQ
jgi:hypothetical protein